MLELRYSAKFKHDYKLAIARGLDVNELDTVIGMLRRGEILPAKYHDHPLRGKWAHHRDCHIHGDWILIYKIDKKI